MIANQSKFIDFLQKPDTKFIIPVYQRNYDWTKEQSAKLLNDIIDVADNEKISSYFIGSIVFICDGIYTTNKINELVIIDGQQRLTTITILWLVLYKKCKENKNERMADEIFEKYIINKFSEGNEEEKLKLKLTQDNDKVFKSLIREDSTEMIRDFSRLIENYQYFYDKISVEDIEKVKRGISKLIYVEISLDRKYDNPQKIFQSLNSTGLALTQSDLIRNYILMDLEPMTQQKIYNDYWKEIEDLTTIKETGESKLSDFIRDYLTIKYRDIPNKNKVFEKFNEKYSFQQDNIEKLINLLKELKNYAYIYSKLINPALEDDIEIRKNINYINRLELGVSYPFFIEVYQDYISKKISKEIYIKVLELIQSYVWRRFIVGLPSNSLNKIFFKLYEDIDRDKYIESLQLSLIRKRGNQKFPNDNEISEELKIKDVYNIQQKNKNYFFELLENFKNPEYVKIEGNADISIEHIFPQTPEKKWKYVLGEEYNKMMEYSNTIANLTLSGFNSSLSNKYFTEKRDMPEKGYKFSRLFLNQFLSKCEKWGLKELDERYKLLVERIIQIWSYPSIDIAIQSSKSTEINIFEIDDPTNKIIDYAIFFNEKIINISFIDLLHKVASFMFGEEPEKFFNSELKDKLNLTSDRKILRKFLKISSTQYIEGNLSAAEIIKRIKMIMEKFNINDEIYLKFKDE